MKILISIIFFFNILQSSVELVIGEERIDPGIIFIFEGAVKDHIMPMGLHLSENETNVHIEARVNWDDKNIPQGAPQGGSCEVAGMGQHAFEFFGVRLRTRFSNGIGNPRKGDGGHDAHDGDYDHHFQEGESPEQTRASRR